MTMWYYTKPYSLHYDRFPGKLLMNLSGVLEALGQPRETE